MEQPGLFQDQQMHFAVSPFFPRGKGPTEQLLHLDSWKQSKPSFGHSSNKDKSKSLKVYCRLQRLHPYQCPPSQQTWASTDDNPKNTGTYSLQNFFSPSSANIVRFFQRLSPFCFKKYRQIQNYHIKQQTQQQKQIQ